MKDVEPTVNIRVSLDGRSPFINVDARIPIYLEDDDLADVFTLMRRSREEFVPDFRAAVLDLDKKWAWTPAVVRKIPLGTLFKILGEDANEVPFPIQKVFSEGEDNEYDTRGKTCGQVWDENLNLCNWAMQMNLKKKESDLDHVDKLGLAALMALSGSPSEEDF